MCIRDSVDTVWMFVNNRKDVDIVWMFLDNRKDVDIVWMFLDNSKDVDIVWMFVDNRKDVDIVWMFLDTWAKRWHRAIVCEKWTRHRGAAEGNSSSATRTCTRGIFSASCRLRAASVKIV